MALARTGSDLALAVTICSGRSGTWLWSQVVRGAGSPLDIAAPVLPISGRSQEEPRLVAAGGGRSWLSWVERDGSRVAGGVVRTALVDVAGELILGPMDVSSLSLAGALGGPAPDSLHSASLSGGGLAVAWLARGGDGALQIRFRLLSPDGRPKTPEIIATPGDHSPKSSHRIHAEDDGSVTLLWTRRGPDGKPDRVFLRRFSATGEPLSDALPMAIDEPKRTQIRPRIVRTGTSEWVVWSEWPGSSGWAEGWIAIRRWSPEDGPVGLTTRFPATFAPYWPLLEAVPDGSGGAFSIFWHADPGDPADPGRLAWRRVVVPDAR
jgi:hypothetical protein